MSEGRRLTRDEIVPFGVLISSAPDRKGALVYTESMTLRELLERVDEGGGKFKDTLTFEDQDGNTFAVSSVRFDKGEIILEGE